MRPLGSTEGPRPDKSAVAYSLFFLLSPFLSCQDTCSEEAFIVINFHSGSVGFCGISPLRTDFPHNFLRISSKKDADPRSVLRESSRKDVENLSSPWWTFRPRKIFSPPPPQKKKSPIRRRHPPGPPPPSWKTPSWDFQ